MRLHLALVVLLVACADVSIDAAYGPPPPRPAALFTTPGYLGPSTGLVLGNDAAVAMYLGAAPFDLADATIEVTWRQVTPAAVGWGEVAIAAGEPLGGNQPLVVVGAGKVATEFGWQGTVTATFQVEQSVPAGQALWLVMAAWSPPGWGQPTVVGAIHADPIRAGVVAVLTVPGWKPSDAIGQPWVFDAQPATRPVTATVVIR